MRKQEKPRAKVWRGPFEAHSLGGKTSSANMTRAERVARGKKARAQRAINDAARAQEKVA